MKRIFWFCFLLVSIAASAQSDTSQIKFIEPPDSTAIGIPDGNLSSKEISPAGGTIVAEDGRVELIFPAGALTDNTNISIQPTTNLAPNGSGKAYQFEPSGIQFKKPVQIIFHYTDDEAENCPPELMSIAMQDHNGKWSFINYEDWDSTAKILKGFILHFSGLSNIYNLKLEADKKLLLPDESIGIQVIDLSRKLSKPVPGWAYEFGVIKNDEAPLLWYVNGFENGNPNVGRIIPYRTQLSNSEKNDGIKKKLVGCTYYAPQYMIKTPVIIRMDLYVFSSKTKEPRRKRQLSCKITIYDAYSIRIAKTGYSVLECNAQLSDASTFFVTIYADKAEIGEVNNYPPILTKNPTCSDIKYDPTGSQGPIDVDKLKYEKNKYKITSDFPPTITMEFLPKVVKIMDRKDKSKDWKEEGIHHYPEEGSPNVGNKIKFIANRMSQRVLMPEAEDERDEETTYELFIFPRSP